MNSVVNLMALEYVKTAVTCRKRRLVARGSPFFDVAGTVGHPVSENYKDRQELDPEAFLNEHELAHYQLAGVVIQLHASNMNTTDLFYPQRIADISFDYLPKNSTTEDLKFPGKYSIYIEAEAQIHRRFFILTVTESGEALLKSDSSGEVSYKGYWTDGRLLLPGGRLTFTREDSLIVRGITRVRGFVEFDSAIANLVGSMLSRADLPELRTISRRPQAKVCCQLQPYYYFALDSCETVIHVKAYTSLNQRATFVHEIHGLSFKTAAGREFGVVLPSRRGRELGQFDLFCIHAKPGQALTYFSCHFRDSTMKFFAAKYMGNWSRRRTVMLLYFLCLMKRARPKREWGLVEKLSHSLPQLQYHLEQIRMQQLLLTLYKIPYETFRTIIEYL